MITTRLENARHTTGGRDRRKIVLILSQVFTPDPASVGQHMGDVAMAMVERGHRVIVLTSNRGYDDPGVVYPSREVRGGVEIRRLPFSSFGKTRFMLRVLAAAFFTLQVCVIAAFLPRIDSVLVSTAPPLCGIAALVPRCLRGTPYVYWMMDLNPDQLIALDSLKANSRSARFLNAVNRAILKKATRVVALDRFMAERLHNKAPIGDRLRIVAPWPHEKYLEVIDHGCNPFRQEHKLAGKFVFMYSGNHSASNPLGTILEAALRFKDDPDVMFLFVGGGLAKHEVDRLIVDHQLENVVSLPYQPLADLRYSLSAADVHIVSLGDPFVGIIHPCKIYGAMASARPILFLGPRPSHITDLLDNHAMGWHLAHGDVDMATEIIQNIRSTSRQELGHMGLEAQRVLRARFSQAELCSAFCDNLEEIMNTAPVAVAAETK